MNIVEPNKLERAVLAICPDVWATINRKKNDSRASESLLWEEMVCCILSSQVSYELARAATTALKRAGCLSLKDQPNYLSRVRSILKKPLLVDGKYILYRFPNVRAYQIASARKELFKEKRGLSNLVYGPDSAEAIRSSLVSRVPGIGMKQASMFLRNIGRCHDLAVVDTHVVRYMTALNIGESKERSASRKSDYLSAELHLRHYATRFGYPVGCLDWAIWIVMRVALRQGYA